MTPDPNEVVEIMRKIFGDDIVDPEIFPRVFKYQVDMAIRELSVGDKDDHSGG